MEKYRYSAALLSGDSQLEELISLLLKVERIDLTVVNRTDIIPESTLLIVDLDRNPLPQKSFSGLIGISSDPDSLSDELKSACSRLIRRPFPFAEMIEAIIDVSKDRNSSPEDSDKNYFVIHHEEKLVLRGTKSVYLTPTELSILTLLTDRRGEVVTRREVEEIVGETISNKATVFVCNLRKKLEKHLDISPITTVHGVGYIIK